MGDYDVYLRAREVRDGDWVGFPLAWKGLAGVAGLPARPHAATTPWIPDPAAPEDPSAGQWGSWRARINVAALDGLVGLEGTPPTDGRTAADMRNDLLLYMALDRLEFKDVDETSYDVRMTGYSEQAAEPRQGVRGNGGWLIALEFTKVE